MSEIEAIAYEELASQSDMDGQSTGDVVSLVWPFAEGVAPNLAATRTQSDPSTTWKSSNPRASRTDASYERLVENLASWADSTARSDEPPSRCVRPMSKIAR